MELPDMEPPAAGNANQARPLDDSAVRQQTSGSSSHSQAEPQQSATADSDSDSGTSVNTGSATVGSSVTDLRLRRGLPPRPLTLPHRSRSRSEATSPALAHANSHPFATPLRASVRLHTGRGSAVGSPSRGTPSPRRVNFNRPGLLPAEADLYAALQHASPSAPPGTPMATTSRSTASTSDIDDDMNLTIKPWHGGTNFDLGSSPKRWLQHADKKPIVAALDRYDAVSIMAYSRPSPNEHANDIWPNCRGPAKMPAHYLVLDRIALAPTVLADACNEQLTMSPSTSELSPNDESGPCSKRSTWKLPLEIVEFVTRYLNRDDIKSLRLVSRELNHFTSQVIFKTVVVPFNTEIYGMLGPPPKPDTKGKKRAEINRNTYSWNNTNGDEVYDGHGLDVFRGFGKHILKFGMSFEVDEDSLAYPPHKLLMEQKTSFWGTYDWPFEEYRRFDEVAGLENAADETPRMKIAFSELSKVRELALSVDSGLGWLSGPDRSIRARILQKPPAVFGTSKDIPDRPAQAQQELWRHIESCHNIAGKDILRATLYRIEGPQPLPGSYDARLLACASQQPSMPYLAPHIIRHSAPYNNVEVSTPSSFDDPDVLDRFLQPQLSSSTGILFSSSQSPADLGHLISPIIPSTLTKAQKEWLMETEWAQRAFMSSYMLSIIDNPATFGPVHTLTISRLSDRYLSMLDRPDFWDALPTLTNVTLMVIPSWRTVDKDETGLVTTPDVSPFASMDAFCGLLNRIALRPNISNLTFGWASGGEQAEGLYARNRLLMPAPVIPGLIGSDTGIASSAVAERDPARLQAALLRFPYLEQLTLRNCWITPPVLLQFVKIHDAYNLKHLVLDSVSMTAILQQIGNNGPQQNGMQGLQIPPALQPIAQAPAVPVIHGLNGPGGALHNNGLGNAALGTHPQFIRIYVQSLSIQLHQLYTNTTDAQRQAQITAVQIQLQQLLLNIHNTQQQLGLATLPAATIAQVAGLTTQVQQIQHQAAAAAPIPATVPATATAPAQPPPSTGPPSILHTQPRPGSWMQTIDIISPGLNLSDFGNSYSQADLERVTSLESIEFISCGYAELPNAGFRQAAVGIGRPITVQNLAYPYIRRHELLAPAMLNSKIPYLGSIVQEVDLIEYAVLDAAWDLKHGWDDVEESRATQFDGLLPGGTGRFSNKIRRSDRLEPSAGSAN